MDLNTEISTAFGQLDKQQPLAETGKAAFADYLEKGWPTQRLENWKYTRLNALVQKPFRVSVETPGAAAAQLPANNRLAGVVATGNTITFVNGRYLPSQSVTEQGIQLLPLNEASEKYPEIVGRYLDQSRNYIADGLQALNTAFVQNGLFIRVEKNAAIGHPVFINHITNGETDSVFVQPRMLVLVEENAQVQFAETYFHNGQQESFTNEVAEFVVQENARMEYYKIQVLPPQAHQVATTHIHQAGKCFTHCATITLSGGTLRNNLNMVFAKGNNEGHMYGLYLVDGTTHVDNQTVVDNTEPGCFSNELYKGVIDGKATAVFNGRIYVRKDAQKTNAYQSNRNILLGSNASVNAKPQLEIFADDVKCSHGCTVGRLDETAMYYMRTRGIGEDMARALLLQAFASDIIDQVNIPALKDTLKEMIAERLHTELS